MKRTHSRRWPAPIHHDGRDYLTTEQVARVLGVKPATVYSYVSRGRLTSSRIDGHDGSVFGVDEVEKLLSGTRNRPPSGVVERIRTQVTHLHDDTLYYRGLDARELARTTAFEEVAGMLWQVPWPDQPADEQVAASVRAVCGDSARDLDRIRIVVDLLGAHEVLRHRIDPESVSSSAALVMATAIAAVGEPVVDPEGTVAERLWPHLTTEPGSPERTSLLNAALVLLADHDLSAGTVAARVAASARGSIYAVLSAGLGAFDGPMHGGATTMAYRFLQSALDNPERAVSERIAADTPIPGTGHVVYSHRDPRAECIIEFLTAANPPDPRPVAALNVVARSIDTREEHHGFITSDLALAAMALSFGMNDNAAETIFALARTAGWTAHALEEYQERRLRFRPEGVYTGVRP
ncbi:helix-turn-helix domain-containing protein [Gordonia amarae]|uniref:citrate synthase (unknown stereospecificity) n=2 Tax=Gordonia amarae TaxID=36821 RepID=G7GTN0_9ACTN|nr:citrate synthase [Gordonia amarae]MCS3877816.1 citrate synthase [Gordonia amarae]QHN16505.1 helix-turn-helix domain-containing protein [Gordonia amarae]QHN21074.1 helix-turn-helix domain-containing protein [Gordonia amarae]QHN29925.1 helix-turn-helix domain-containing protein [Gordonia amarae]QHN38701.1 helix-turn-helix domain-containing protein [Gordonia amarae]